MAIISIAIKMAVMIVLGFFLYKIKILNKVTNTSFSQLLINVTCTCLIFASIVSLDHDKVTPAEIGIIFAIGFACYFVSIIIAFLLTKLLRVKKGSQGVAQYLLVFPNVGFIGIPIAGAFYGELGLFYMSILNVHLNLFLFTYGLFLISQDGKKAAKFSIKKFFSPTIVSIIVSLIIFFLRIEIPDIVLEPFSFIGNLTAPISLLLVGSSIASFSLKDAFTNWRVYVITFVKLVAFPIFSYFIAKAIFGPGIMTNITTLSMAMPPAIIAVMFSIIYEGDEKFAASGVAMGNLLSIITLPFVYMMTQYW